MRERPITLRTTLSAITISVACLALGVTVSLALLTEYLHRTSASLAKAVEAVRAAEETQIALLDHERARDPAKRRLHEAETFANLATVRRDITSPAVGQLAAEAESLIQRYLAAVRSGAPAAEVDARHDEAYRALDAVSALNVRQAQEARDEAARWDRRLNLVSTAAAACVLLLAGWLTWWMRTQAFQPLLALARAMERFGQGDLEARAEERGPAELREMVERFNQMAAALAAQREAQIAFLGGVAHDLRNPLSALSMSVSLIDPNQPLPPEPRLRRTIGIVQRQIAKLERMINDLMDMTKIDSGQLELAIEPRDLRGVVQEVTQLFEVNASEHKIVLSLPPEPVCVACDPLRVEQVVTNLVSNAIKYSPSARKVEVGVERDGSDAVISVRDYGIGISEEDQRHLFEPFRRASLAKETIPGAGLGLYVVRRLVDAHGGRIEVSSQPGQGARFSVRLPLERAAA